MRVPNEHGGHVEFEGTRLAHASSDDGKAQRWTELTLYRTTTGGYVLHKVGRSVVYHAADATCSKEAQRVQFDGLVAREFSDGVTFLPCVRCRPLDLADGQTGRDHEVLLESDRHAAVVSATADGVVEHLRGRDGDGVQFMTRVARTLLERADDPAIQEAFRVQRV